MSHPMWKNMEHKVAQLKEYLMKEWPQWTVELHDKGITLDFSPLRSDEAAEMVTSILGVVGVVEGCCLHLYIPNS